MTAKMKLIGEFKVIPFYNANIWCMLLDVVLYKKMYAVFAVGSLIKLLSAWQH